jgi:hypothetical protein
MTRTHWLERWHPTPKATALALALLIGVSGLFGSPREASAGSAGDEIVFAVIGDYGLAGNAQRRVSDMIKSHDPDFIITTGDNNYESGSASTIDANVGQYYCEYIYPYTGSYCPGGPVVEYGRFFPSLGNHDLGSSSTAAPYRAYFTLPGNERYYDYIRGPVHFIVRNTETDADGKSWSSDQGRWAKDVMENSTSPWMIVYQHKSAYSSGDHGDGNPNQFWPVHDYGVDAVLSGHDHDYERIHRDGILHFVNGIGGGGIREFEATTPGSQVRYNADHGAMIVRATSTEINFKFYNASNVLIDDYTITQEGSSGLAAPYMLD